MPSDNDYKYNYNTRFDEVPEKKKPREDGPFGKDKGSVGANFKAGTGFDDETNAQAQALDNKLKKAKAWGY